MSRAAAESARSLPRVSSRILGSPGSAAAHEPRPGGRHLQGSRSVDGQRAYSVAVFFDDDDRSGGQLALDKGEDPQECCRPVGNGVAHSSEQQNTGPIRPGKCEDPPEVRVGGHEQSSFVTGSFHDLLVGSASEAERSDMGRVMAGISELIGDGVLQRLIDEESHAVWRGTTRSSTLAAAKRRASRMSSRRNCGYCSRRSASDVPFATMRTTIATGIRVPAMQGTPPMMRWSTLIRVNVMARAYAETSIGPVRLRTC